MRISRHSIGNGRKSSFIESISAVFSRTKRNGGSPAQGNRWLLLLIAVVILVLSSTILTRSNSHRVRHLRYLGTMPTRVPQSVVETVIKKFDRNSFQTKHLTPPPGTMVILFYNLYIPHEAEAVQHVIDVVNEQLGQVTKSLKQLEEGKQGVVLFYNLIGNNFIPCIGCVAIIFIHTYR